MAGRDRRIGALLAGVLAVLLALVAVTSQPSGERAAAAEPTSSEDDGAAGTADPTDDGAEAPVAHAEPVPVEVACPTDQVLPARFDDVPLAGTHAPGIDCLWWYGLAGGRSDGTYRPLADVSRAAFATLLVALLEASGADLPSSPDDAFTDDDLSIHQPALNTLAALGVMGGSGDGTVGPAHPVKRGQLASMLVAAWPHLTGETLPRDGDVFPDDDDSVHEDALDRLGTVGLLLGDEAGNVHPGARGTRAQLATMFARVLARIVDAGAVTPPSPVEAEPVRGQAEVVVVSADPNPSVYAVDETVPVDQEAVDAFVAATTTWLDEHLTDLAAGDTSRLEARVVAPVTHERWRAATTDLLWRTAPSDVRYRILVTEFGAPLWASVEVRLTRDGRSVSWEVLVAPRGDGILVVADGPGLDTEEAAGA